MIAVLGVPPRWGPPHAVRAALGAAGLIAFLWGLGQR
jgi:hypothetical protein